MMEQFEVWSHDDRQPMLVVWDREKKRDYLWGFYRFVKYLPLPREEAIRKHHDEEYRSGLDSVSDSD